MEKGRMKEEGGRRNWKPRLKMAHTVKMTM